jgi:hypothetical protein
VESGDWLAVTTGSSAAGFHRAVKQPGKVSATSTAKPKRSGVAATARQSRSGTRSEAAPRASQRTGAVAATIKPRR